MLLLTVTNYRQCHCYCQLINRRCHGIEENLGQGLITSDNNTGEQLIAGVNNSDDKHKVVNISAKFCKNSKWPQGNTQGTRENSFMKKKQNKKTFFVRLSLQGLSHQIDFKYFDKIFTDVDQQIRDTTV